MSHAELRELSQFSVDLACLQHRRLEAAAGKEEGEGEEVEKEEEDDDRRRVDCGRGNGLATMPVEVRCHDTPVAARQQLTWTQDMDLSVHSIWDIPQSRRKSDPAKKTIQNPPS